MQQFSMWIKCASCGKDEWLLNGFRSKYAAIEAAESRGWRTLGGSMVEQRYVCPQCTTNAYVTIRDEARAKR